MSLHLKKVDAEALRFLVLFFLSYSISDLL